MDVLSGEISGGKTEEVKSDSGELWEGGEGWSFKVGCFGEKEGGSLEKKEGSFVNFLESF